MTSSLLKQGSPLALASEQLRILDGDVTRGHLFGDVLARHGLGSLKAGAIEILQLNLGKLCNQTCRHCHVDAGPDRREIMSPETADECLRVLRDHDIPTVDLTGGAPEMNPEFRRLVDACRGLGRRVIDRCNLTILTAPGYEDLPEFLASRRVEVVASLPCYLEENVDRQRGDFVFRRSIEALRTLNGLGYGRPETGLSLTLVFNPLGPSLPPDQAKLEEAYRKELAARHSIVFTRLITITNLPISRFLDDLLQSGRYDEYLRKLVAAFNPATVDGLMCRNTLSVDWEGRLYDCDFNQMLGLTTADGAPRHIRDFSTERLRGRSIVTGRHCFGCTAGAGSSCQGRIVSS